MTDDEMKVVSTTDWLLSTVLSSLTRQTQIKARASQMRGQVVTNAKTLIKSHYGFISDADEVAIEQNRQLFARLTDHAAYAYTVSSDICLYEVQVFADVWSTTRTHPIAKSHEPCTGTQSLWTSHKTCRRNCCVPFSLSRRSGHWLSEQGLMVVPPTPCFQQSTLVESRRCRVHASRP